MSRAARLLVVPAAAATLLLAASPAWAHVHVDAQASTGGVTLSFHVPNEETPAHTTTVVVAVPPGLGALTPVASGAWRPTLAGDRITWTGGAIGGTGSADFRVQVASLPSGVDTLTFKVLQTYDSGETVAWIEEAPPGAPEPEHPAPVLDVRAAGLPPAVIAPTAPVTVSAVAPTVAVAPTPVAAPPAPPSPPAPAPSGTGTLVGGIGAVAGLTALGGLLAWRRRQSRGAERPASRP